jgi:hypothetical protein
MDKDKRDIRILLSEERERGDSYFGPTLRITATVVDFQYDHDKGKHCVRNILDGFGGDDGLANLQASAHSYKSDPATDDSAFFIGYAPEYRTPYSVELERAEAMVRTLRKIKRALDKDSETYGTASNFAEWLPRFARAVGVKDKHPFIIRQGKQTAMYDEGDYAERSADHAQRWISDKLSEFNGKDA